MEWEKSLLQNFYHSVFFNLNYVFCCFYFAFFFNERRDARTKRNLLSFIPFFMNLCCSDRFFYKPVSLVNV